MPNIRELNSKERSLKRASSRYDFKKKAKKQNDLSCFVYHLECCDKALGQSSKFNKPRQDGKSYRE